MAGSAPGPALNLKERGDLAELMVATDLMRRGHKIAIPYGEDCDFDLTIDLLAVYDVTSNRCYYLPATELGTGRSTLHLRLKPAKNGQRVGTRPADNYLDP